MRLGATALTLLLVLLPGALLLATAPHVGAVVEDRPLVTAVIMEGEHSAAPRTSFDGVEEVGLATSTGDAYNRMRRALDLRHASGAPYEVTLGVAIRDGGLHATAQYLATRDDAPAEPRVRFLLVEDAGAQSPPARRFLLHGAAAGHAPATHDRAADGGTASVVLPIDDSLRPLRLGVIALVEEARTNGSSGGSPPVLQAALWIDGQDGPTVQRAKGVYVEHRSADGCAPCAIGDEALALLLTQNGFAAEADAEGARYFVAPGARAATGLLAGAALGVALLRRRA